MTYEKINEAIKTSDYDFLRMEHHLALGGETKYMDECEREV